MLALDRFDLDRIAEALQDQSACELRRLVEPRTGVMRLSGKALVSQEAADRFIAENPDPDLRQGR
ncbi:hypothetical protein [Amycolatopsis sp. NPDC004079]|uniref:hypothetical protein n=1 Tax=Amycolatopsis sp. NPDC004079 TaxID=3154549 RepID=UPI0033A1D1A0